jgi:hypothetical protein
MVSGWWLVNQRQVSFSVITKSTDHSPLLVRPRRGRCPIGSHKADYPVRYRGLGHCGRAGARPSFISSEAVVRIPGPQFGVR